MSEAGDHGYGADHVDKYAALRTVLATHFNATPPAEPPAVVKKAYGSVPVTGYVSLWDALPQLAVANVTGVRDIANVTMEGLGQVRPTPHCPRRGWPVPRPTGCRTRRGRSVEVCPPHQRPHAGGTAGAQRRDRAALPWAGEGGVGGVGLLSPTRALWAHGVPRGAHHMPLPRQAPGRLGRAPS